MAKKKSKAKKRPMGKSKRPVAKKKAVKKKAKSSSKAKTIAKKATKPARKKVKAKAAPVAKKAAKKARQHGHGGVRVVPSAFGITTNATGSVGLIDASGLKFERVLQTHSPFQIIEASRK